MYDKTWPEKKSYIRQNFPDVSFIVTGVRKGNSDAEGDYVIRTDAKQTVTTYALSLDIATGELTMQANGTTVDKGYNMHSGKNGFANWLSQTLGCIRIEPATAKMLYELYLKQVEPSGGSMTGRSQE